MPDLVAMNGTPCHINDVALGMARALCLLLILCTALGISGCAEKQYGDKELLELAKSESTGERMKAAGQMCDRYKPAFQNSLFNLCVDPDAGVRDIIYRNIHKTKDPKFVIQLEESRYSVPVEEKDALSGALKRLHEAIGK